ncbi:MAG: hypothetical protein R3F36_01330 [Candidatus Competibacteraceae bacterium]
MSGEVQRERTTCADFESALAELTRAVGEAAADRTADRIADTLYTALNEARDADRQRKQADAAIVREQDGLDRARPPPRVSAAAWSNCCVAPGWNRRTNWRRSRNKRRTSGGWPSG